MVLSMLALLPTASAVTVLSENFDSYIPPSTPTFPPTGWVVYNPTGGDQWALYSGASTAHSGLYCARCYYDVPNDDWLVTKSIVMPASPVAFSVWMRGSSLQPETFELWYSTTGNTITDFTSTGTQLVATSAPTTYTLFSYTIPVATGTTVWFAVHYTANDMFYIYADDFTFPDGTTQGFEGTPAVGWPPAGWTMQVVSGTDIDNYWKIQDPTTYPSGVIPTSGAYMAEYDVYIISSGNSARLYTPALNFGPGTACTLYFNMYRCDDYPTYNDNVQVQVSTNGATWTTLATYTTYGTPEGWHNYMVDLSAYDGAPTVYVGFLGTSYYGMRNAYIDDIQIDYIGAPPGMYVQNTVTGIWYPTIQTAHDDPLTLDGHTLMIIATTLAEGPVITITKDLTIYGAGCGSTTIVPTGNTGTSGDARAWILIQPGAVVHLSDFTLDGNGFLICQGIRQKGSGTVDHVCFQNIGYNPSTNYLGWGIAVMGDGPTDITYCTFDNIGRINGYYYGTAVSGSVFDYNTVTGKGDGNWLDYGLEVEFGASISASYNVITDCRGVAASDGSGSAAIMATTYFGPGTGIEAYCNQLFDNSVGLYIGYNTADTTVAVAHGNEFVGNTDGAYTASGTVIVDATCNWWGANDGPSGVGPGSGDTVWENILYDPWTGVIANAGGPYAIEGYYTYTFSSVFSTVDASCGTVTYLWTFGDGGTSTEANPTHTFPHIGTYPVTLTITITTDCGFSYSDTASTYAQVFEGGLDEQPTVIITEPKGGETLKGAVAVKWWIHDSQDQYNHDLPITLFYVDESHNAHLIYTGVMDKTEYLGEYSWTTTSVPDGEYSLLLEAVDSNGNIGNDQTKPFQIRNNDAPPANRQPNTPSRPSGNTNGKVGVEYTYSSITTDPDGDQIWFLFDWGDNTNSGWLGPFTSGEVCEASHAWTDKASYSVKVQARDIFGAISDWSEPLPITMPYKYSPILQFLQTLLERFPNAFPVLRQILG